jgi:hypothetical protein
MHKHRLRIMGPSATKKTMLFACTTCLEVHLYRRSALYGMLLKGFKYRKRYKKN